MTKRVFWKGMTLVAVLALLVPVLPASGQQTDEGRLNLTTSPLPINLVTKPGNKTTTDLRIKNSGNTAERLQVGLMKFSAFGNDGKPRLADREPGDDYFDWVQFSESEFDAEPNVWKTITMTIDVPKEAAFGYYYAVTFSRATPTDPNNETAAVEGATAVLVLLEVDAPGARRSLELTNFTVGKNVYEFLPSRFTIEFKNTGNIHIKPTGTIFISSRGKDIGQVQVNPGSGNILPSSSRSYESAWQEGFPYYAERVVDNKTITDEDGNIAYDLVWDWKELPQLRFGKYTATLIAVYDDGTRDVPLEATVSFWVIPWRILGAFLFIAAFVCIGLFSAGRKVWRTAKRKFGKNDAKS